MNQSIISSSAKIGDSLKMAQKLFDLIFDALDTYLCYFKYKFEFWRKNSNILYLQVWSHSQAVGRALILKLGPTVFIHTYLL